MTKKEIKKIKKNKKKLQQAMICLCLTFKLSHRFHVITNFPSLVLLKKILFAR